MCLIRVETAAGVASAVVKSMTRSEPLSPPETAPIARPSTLTMPDETVTVPSVRIDSWSSGRPLEPKLAVSLPVLKSDESMSVTTPSGAINLAPSFSV